MNTKTWQSGVQLQSFHPIQSLPDPDICRAKGRSCGDAAWCLVAGPARCRYQVAFGVHRLCRHPQREQIVARTKQTKRPAPRLPSIERRAVG
ncbi:MAG: hypothetical protein HZC54_13355 [Verrucomicrobia bacterium]|nr:hypothetical protein [Verrucomicrobiota bacterium]